MISSQHAARPALGLQQAYFSEGMVVALRREDTIDDSQMMRQQMAAMGGGAAPGADVQKLFDSERQGLELVCANGARPSPCNGSDRLGAVIEPDETLLHVQIAHKSVLDRAEEAAAELLRNRLMDAD